MGTACDSAPTVIITVGNILTGAPVGSFFHWKQVLMGAASDSAPAAIITVGTEFQALVPPLNLPRHAILESRKSL